MQGKGREWNERGDEEKGEDGRGVSEWVSRVKWDAYPSTLGVEGPNGICLFLHITLVRSILKAMA